MINVSDQSHHLRARNRYRHVVEEGPSALESDYGIDMAERVGVDRTILDEARRLKKKIQSATPDFREITETENEAREV